MRRSAALLCCPSPLSLGERGEEICWCETKLYANIARMNSMNREQVTWVGLCLLGVIGLILFNTPKADTNLQPIVAVTALAILFSLPEAGTKTHRLAVCAVGALYVAYGAFPSIMEKNFSGSFLGMSLPDTA